MTVTEIAITNPWISPEVKRSSIELENGQFLARLPVENPFRVSSGISSSAKLVQAFINIMLTERNRWQETLVSTTPNDVEKDIVVFLPPKKSRVVKLHIQNVYRPDPLISLEE